MVQKTGELKTGQKTAKGIKKPTFTKLKTEGVQPNPAKQEKLNNALVIALNEGNVNKIERLKKAHADMSAIKQTTKEFYNDDIDKALEECQKEGYRAMSMPELIDARINGKAKWDKRYSAPSVIATGKTKEGKAVVVIAHIPNYFSDPKNIRTAKEKGLVNGAGKMPQKEFQKLVDAKDNKNVFVVDCDKLKNSESDRISISEALEHPEVIPFLGGKERAENYLAKHKEAYNTNTIGVYHQDDLSEKGPVGRVLYAGSGGGLVGSDLLCVGGRFLGVRYEIAEGEAKKAKAPSLNEMLEYSRKFMPKEAQAEFEQGLRQLYE